MKILWTLPMFTSIKAKLNMYKWTFVICTFFGLSVIAGIQFFQIKNMKLVNTHSQETIEEQKEEIKKLASKVSEQEIRTNNAIDRLTSLRDEITQLTKDTRILESKFGKIPKPVSEGANAADIEREVNTLSDEILDRMRNAAKADKK